jgi:hypothetical protein
LDRRGALSGLDVFGIDDDMSLTLRSRALPRFRYAALNGIWETWHFAPALAGLASDVSMWIGIHIKP